MTTLSDTREHHIHMARIYLLQAHVTLHRPWAFTLLQWAGKRRKQAMLVRPELVQADLFGDGK